MTEVRIPNLELMLYRAKGILSKCKEYSERFAECNEADPDIEPEYELECFSQLWDNKGIGFDTALDGSPVYQRSDDPTEAYTTIVRERITGIYVIFFGSRFCYVVCEENDKFRDDLLSRKMSSLAKARERYILSVSNCKEAVEWVEN